MVDFERLRRLMVDNQLRTSNVTDRRVLAAMLAVGVWSAIAVRPVWMAPLAFVVMLTLGAVLGLAGVQVPAVEPMIAASLLVIGLLMARRQDMSWTAAAVLAGVLAVFHGAAHGSELSAAQAWPALAGMVTGSALLHAGGVLIGQRLRQKKRPPHLARGGQGEVLRTCSSHQHSTDAQRFCTRPNDLPDRTTTQLAHQSS